MPVPSVPTPSPGPATTAGTLTVWLVASGPVLAALITVVGTLVMRAYVDGRLKRAIDLAVARLTTDAARELELLRAEIARLRAESDADLAFRLQARIHGYADLHPLAHQLREAARAADTALQEALHGGDGEPSADRVADWAYRMIAPHALGRLLAGALTDADSDVAPELAHCHALVQRLRAVWLAPPELLGTHPAVEPPERPVGGLTDGAIDALVQALIVTGNGRAEVLSLGAYRTRLAAAGDGLRSLAVPVRLWLMAARAGEHPCLSRVAAGQHLLLVALGNGVTVAAAPDLAPPLPRLRPGDDMAAATYLRAAVPA